MRDEEAMFQGQEIIIRTQGEEDEDVSLPLHLKTHRPVLPPHINAERNQQGHLAQEAGKSLDPIHWPMTF